MTMEDPMPTRRLFAKRAAAFALLGVLVARVCSQIVEPLPVDVLQTSSQVASGSIFISPNGPGGLTPLPDAIQGPEILDSQGRPIWFLALGNDLAADFRVQTYQ